MCLEFEFCLLILFSLKIEKENKNRDSKKRHTISYTHSHCTLAITQKLVFLLTIHRKERGENTVSKTMKKGERKDRKKKEIINE